MDINICIGDATKNEPFFYKQRLVSMCLSSIVNKFKQEHDIDDGDIPFPYPGGRALKIKAKEILGRPENLAELHKILQTNLTEYREEQNKRQQRKEQRLKKIEQINELARLLLPDRLPDSSQLDLTQLDFTMNSKGIDSLGMTHENLLDTWSVEELKEEYQEHVVEVIITYQSTLLISAKFILDPDLDYDTTGTFGPTYLFWRNDRWTKVEIRQTEELDLDVDSKTTVLLTYFEILNREDNPMLFDICYIPCRFYISDDDRNSDNWLSLLLGQLKFSTVQQEDYFDRFYRWQTAKDDTGYLFRLNFDNYYQYVKEKKDKIGKIEQFPIWPPEEKIFSEQCSICEERYQLVFECKHTMCISCYKQLTIEKCPCCRLMITDKVYLGGGGPEAVTP